MSANVENFSEIWIVFIDLTKSLSLGILLSK
jgi:hypothetical protein